ncbi:hypothetical protein [Kitasatospora sp. NPDC090308]|uniref:hypothetical protein n=1 Tax=Kitasatospora sp. NPDC090308 TaxID=3364082 RepID=UPI00382A5866
MSITAVRRRGVLPAALLLCAGLTAAGVVGAERAHADPAPPPPPTTSCDPATDSSYYSVTAVVTPVVTDFLAVNVGDGTTGQRTETLSQVSTVSTTVDKSVEISASAGPVFVKVEAKVGFSVSNTTSSTSTSTVSTTWNFAKAGYYGLYRGTRRVDGTYAKYVCAQTGPATGVWINAQRGGYGTYTTYETPEIGTVTRNCAAPEPAGTVRRAAQDRLGTC